MLQTLFAGEWGRLQQQGEEEKLRCNEGIWSPDRYKNNKLY